MPYTHDQYAAMLGMCAHLGMPKRVAEYVARDYCDNAYNPRHVPVTSAQADYDRCWYDILRGYWYFTDKRALR